VDSLLSLRLQNVRNIEDPDDILGGKLCQGEEIAILQQIIFGGRMRVAFLIFL